MKQYIYFFIGFALVGFGISQFINNQSELKDETKLEASISDIKDNNTTKDNNMTDGTNPIIKMKTTKGDITIELFRDKSPKTVGYIMDFVKEKYYDGILFHRVIKGFMIQGGDPLTKDPSKKALFGTGGPDFEFDDEFNDEKLVKGSIAMANSGKNTNGSQFFIVTAESTPWLDGAHTNFGKVIEGLEVAEKIESVEVDSNDLPLEDVKINTIEIIKE